MVRRKIVVALVCAFAICACRKASVQQEETLPEVKVELSDVAQIMSGFNLGIEQLKEVHDAVQSSSENGYDEEYTMKDLFESPGSGVGEDQAKSVTSRNYSKPLREFFKEYSATKSLSMSLSLMTPEEYLDCLSSGDIQIYWPFSDEWDGKTFPIITFDPLSEQTANKGYVMDSQGKVSEIIVTEEIAAQRPVWVINRNDDAQYQSLDLYLKNNPDWGGGSINVQTKTSTSGSRALVLKDFTMLRHYDSWFRGASEFMIRAGAVESFTGKTDDDLQNYTPTITDFMISLKRNMLGKKKEVNTILVSDWTEQLENCAFMITEDDGGSRTSWKCNAVVKYNSRSYGFEIELPYRAKDDIVWRGQLHRKYIEANKTLTGYFGDVQITFDIIEY